MNIAVLVKQVPDLVEELEVASDGKSLDPAALKWKLNEFDDHALEEALLLKEGAGAEVTAIAASGEEADKILYTALAKGATRAWKIAGVDGGAGNLALATAVAAVLRQKPHDLILTGVQAADDRDGQLGPMVAALLGLPSVEERLRLFAGPAAEFSIRSSDAGTTITLGIPYAHPIGNCRG